MMDTSRVSLLSAVASQKPWRDKLRYYDSDYSGSVSPRRFSSPPSPPAASVSGHSPHSASYTSTRRAQRPPDTTRSSPSHELNESYTSRYSSASSSSPVARPAGRYNRSPYTSPDHSYASNRPGIGDSVREDREPGRGYLAAKYPKYYGRKPPHSERASANESYMSTVSPSARSPYTRPSRYDGLRRDPYYPPRSPRWRELSREEREEDASILLPSAGSGGSPSHRLSPYGRRPLLLLLSPKRSSSSGSSRGSTEDASGDDRRSKDEGARERNWGSTDGPATADRHRHHRHQQQLQQRRGYGRGKQSGRLLLSPEKTVPNADGSGAAPEAAPLPLVRHAPAVVSLYDAFGDSSDDNSVDPLDRFQARQAAGSPPLIPDNTPKRNADAVGEARRLDSVSGPANGSDSGGYVGWLGKFLEEMAVKSRRQHHQQQQQQGGVREPRRVVSDASLQAEADPVTQEAVAAAAAAAAGTQLPRSPPPPLSSLSPLPMLNGSESAALEHLHVLALEEQLDLWRQRALHRETASVKRRKHLQQRRRPSREQHQREEARTDRAVRKLRSRQTQANTTTVATMPTPMTQNSRNSSANNNNNNNNSDSSDYMSHRGGEPLSAHEAPARGSGAGHTEGQGLPPSPVIAPAEEPPVMRNDGGDLFHHNSEQVSDRARRMEDSASPSREATAALVRQSLPSARSISSTRAGSSPRPSPSSTSSSSPSPPSPSAAPRSLGGTARPPAPSEPQGHLPQQMPVGPSVSHLTSPQCRIQGEEEKEGVEHAEEAEATTTTTTAEPEKAAEKSDPQQPLAGQLRSMQGELSTAERRIAELKRALVRAREQRQDALGKDAGDAEPMGAAVPPEVRMPSAPSAPVDEQRGEERHITVSTQTEPRMMKAESEEAAPEQPANSIVEERLPPAQPAAAAAPPPPVAAGRMTLDRLSAVLDTAQALEEANNQLRRLLREQDGVIEQLELDRLARNKALRRQQLQQELSSLSALNSTPSVPRYAGSGATSAGAAVHDGDRSFEGAVHPSEMRREGRGGHKRAEAGCYPFGHFGAAAPPGRDTRVAFDEEEPALSRFCAQGQVFELADGDAKATRTSSPFRGVYEAADNSPLLTRVPVATVAAHAPPPPMVPQPSRWATLSPHQHQQQQRLRPKPLAEVPAKTSDARSIADAIHRRSHRFVSPPHPSRSSDEGNENRQGGGGTAATTEPASHPRWQEMSAALLPSQSPPLHPQQPENASRLSYYPSETGCAGSPHHPSSSSSPRRTRREQPTGATPIAAAVAAAGNVSSLSDPAWNDMSSFEEKFKFLW